jgi:hypothetical protein
MNEWPKRGDSRPIRTRLLHLLRGAITFRRHLRVALSRFQAVRHSQMDAINDGQMETDVIYYSEESWAAATADEFAEDREPESYEGAHWHTLVPCNNRHFPCVGKQVESTTRTSTDSENR